MCLHFLRSYILLLHPIVLCVFAYNYLHTHKIYEKEIEEGEKRRRTGEKIISGASSLVQDHQNETGALQMRYQCLWITISLSQSLCFWLSFHCCEQLSKKIIPNIFYGGFVFIFSPCFQKIPIFFFFCKQPGTAHCWWSETISPLKKNSWWNYKKKKTYKKALGGSVLSWIAVQVRES